MVNRPWKGQCTSCTDDQILPHDFERHQWQKSSRTSLLYLIYKWFIALQFTIILIYSVFHVERYGKTNSTYWKWFIYLTNWGYTMCTIQAIIALWIVQSARIKKVSLKDGRTLIPSHYKAYWILHNAATDVAFTITFMYWFSVYNPEIHHLDAINVLVHAGNSIIMFAELWIVKHTCPIIYGIYGIMTGLSYTLFTYIYYVCGGTDRAENPHIYETMDWRQPKRAVMFSAISVGVVTVAHAISWSTSSLRRWISECRKEKISLDSPLAMQEKPMFSDIA